MTTGGMRVLMAAIRTTVRVIAALERELSNDSPNCFLRKSILW